MNPPLRELSREGGRIVLLGVIANATLAVVKVAAGVWGGSHALIADGIESATDIFSSVLIWGALQIAGKPPDAGHPYGHGKLESLAAVAGSIFVIGAGASVAVTSGIDLIAQFRGAGEAARAPAGWTLAVLVGVIAIKEIFFRVMRRRGEAIGSSSLMAEAWHHRSDALTSLAAFVGISIALIGGPGWEGADNWAALFSCGIIFTNGLLMFRRSIGEVIDEQVSPEVVNRIVSLACEIPGVTSAEKCRVRKSGLSLIADLHVRVSGDRTVRDGHEITHRVKDHLMDAGLNLSDVTLHLEPAAEVGNRERG